MVWIWLSLFAAAIAASIYAALQKGDRSKSDRDRAWFCGTMLIFVVGAYYAFLYAASQPTNIWYYTPLMGFLATGFDSAFFLAGASHGVFRIVRVVLAAAITVAVVPFAWSDAQVRATNVDLIAAVLEEKADKDDLIVVVPWWPGVTFTRYYHGATPWTTLPDLGPLRVQRYDVFKLRMEETGPIRPVLERIAATLHGGHRLWIIGGLAALGPNEKPGDLPPLPQGPLNESPYLTVWSRQLTYLLMQHAQRLTVVPVATPRPVSGNENENLLLIEGWH